MDPQSGLKTYYLYHNCASNAISITIGSSTTSTQINNAILGLLTSQNSESRAESPSRTPKNGANLLKLGKKKKKALQSSEPGVYREVTSIAVGGSNITLDLLYSCKENTLTKPYSVTIVERANVLAAEAVLNQIKALVQSFPSFLGDQVAQVQILNESSTNLRNISSASLVDKAEKSSPKDLENGEEVAVVEEVVEEEVVECVVEGDESGPSKTTTQVTENGDVVEIEEEVVEFGEIEEAQMFPLPLSLVLAGTRDLCSDATSELDQELAKTERAWEEQDEVRKREKEEDAKAEAEAEAEAQAKAAAEAKEEPQGKAAKTTEDDAAEKEKLEREKRNRQKFRTLDRLQALKMKRELELQNELEQREKEEEERKRMIEEEAQKKEQEEEQRRKEREEAQQRRREERLKSMSAEERKKEDELDERKKERERRRLERERRRKEREERRRQEEEAWEKEQQERLAARAQRRADREQSAVREKREQEEKKRQEEEALVTQIQTMANDRVVKDVSIPPNRRMSRAQVFPAGLDGRPDVKAIREYLLKEGRLEDKVAQELCTKVLEVLKKEPNMFSVDNNGGTSHIVGDIHGQYYDLVKIIEKIGTPDEDNTYVFLGDYVDRGLFSCEVIFYLFAFKLTYPNSVLLLRGNHECRMITTYYSFRKECAHKYSVDTYRGIMKCFDALPLAATISTDKGKFLCLHGGLSPELNSLQDIVNLNRFEEVPSKGLFCDLLWADPTKELEQENPSKEDLEEWQALGFDKNISRECSFVYGASVAKAFLDKNHLCCLVRAHEVQPNGYYEHFYKLEDLDIPLVVTVFSAPNYCDKYENMGATMRLESSGEYSFDQYSWETHPYVLPNFVEALTFSIPFIAENISKFFWTVLKELNEGEEAEEDKELADAISEKIKHTGRMMVSMKKIREKNEEAVAPITLKYMENLSRFDQVLKDDAKNEIRPMLDKHRKRNPQLWRNVSTPLPRFLNVNQKVVLPSPAEMKREDSNDVTSIPRISPKSKFKTLKIKRVKRVKRGGLDGLF